MRGSTVSPRAVRRLGGGRTGHPMRPPGAPGGAGAARDAREDNRVRLLTGGRGSPRVGGRPGPGRWTTRTGSVGQPVRVPVDPVRVGPTRSGSQSGPKPDFGHDFGPEVDFGHDFGHDFGPEVRLRARLRADSSRSGPTLGSILCPDRVGPTRTGSKAHPVRVKREPGPGPPVTVGSPSYARRLPMCNNYV